MKVTKCQIVPEQDGKRFNNAEETSDISLEEAKEMASQTCFSITGASRGHLVFSLDFGDNRTEEEFKKTPSSKEGIVTLGLRFEGKPKELLDLLESALEARKHLRR